MTESFTESKFNPRNFNTHSESTTLLVCVFKSNWMLGKIKHLTEYKICEYRKNE